MREPASPDGAKEPENEAPTGQAVVSIPDRRRIDSDVRAFLREPSTPWIVFDQEVRPPSQLAVGEVLSVPRKMLLSAPSYYTATAAIDAAAAYEGRPEPSSLAVASDLTDDEDVHTSAGPLGAGANAIPMRRLSKRVIGASAGAFALVVTLAVGAVALRSSTSELDAPHAAATQPAARSFGASVPAEIPPPELDVKAAAPVARAASPAIVVNVAGPATGIPVADSPAQAAAKKYGRLSVVGDARSRDVFMDGKRMLGRGARSFTVMCGTHTVAVGNRSDAHEVEIPCTGTAELLIGK